jgi:Secretion system C-terminal sorting domain
MNNKLTLLLLIVILATGITSKGQELVRKVKIAGKCYASNSVNKIYIPPPKEFYLKRGRKGANITVYYSGFTLPARTAYNYAVSILESILPDNTSFTVNASWGPLSDNTVLASTGPGTFIDGRSINALDPFAYYPVALAGRIAGKNMSLGASGDVIMNVNSNIAWYTGTDGQPVHDTYDLVTVVLHELCHGIGFFDSFSASGTIADYGINSIPAIYDTFVQDLNGKFLTDTTAYLNNSWQLYSTLTSNSVYFKGKVLTSRARLYAPSVWDPGSSISHLDEDSYQSIPDALMTPFLAKQEAIHSPGPVIRAMLGEIGWINTRIIHTPFTDTEKNLTQVNFGAVIQSDTSFIKDKVGLVYSFDKFTSRDTVYLNQVQPGDSFKISLSVPSYNTFVSYYFYVTDYFGRVYSLPSMGGSAPYSFFIGTDTVKPTINHVPPDYIIDRLPALGLKATADDNLGIDTVYIEYRKNDGAFSYLGLHHDSLDIYSNYLEIKSMDLTSDDSLQYRIVATDSSSSHNRNYSPSTGYYTLKPEKTFNVAESYTTDFSGSAGDFINRGFSVTTPSGFSDPALHSKHPYESPDKDGDSIVYTSVLRYPLKVDSSRINVSYMEIVLVEPGEPGSVYGSPDFYDYVIVEGSKNFGETWFPMADGYDSRISLSFLGDYNSSIVGMNSTYVGTPGMFAKHTISVNALNRFSKGDTLLIRFRLYSDPYAHGWGWAVDDLSIKSVADFVPKTGVTDMKIYPNPGSGLIKIQSSDATLQEPDYRVLSLSGTVVQNGKITAGDYSLIDISSQPPGIYIIIIKSGNAVNTFRYTKIK